MALRRDEEHDNPLLVARDHPDSPGAESYRTLRANLRFSSLDNPPKSLLITSAVPGEGKSTVAANLAVSSAHAGSRVILVGADLRRPTITRYFGMSQAVGLANVLTGHATLTEALRETSVAGLRVLTSGPIPPNPGELLGADRMAEIVADLHGEADMILFDTPPVASVADASILVRRLDGALLVVSAGTTPKDAVKAAKDQLDKVGARILGTVMNRLDQPSDHYRYYYADQSIPAPLTWWRRLQGAYR